MRNNDTGHWQGIYLHQEEEEGLLLVRSVGHNKDTPVDQ